MRIEQKLSIPLIIISFGNTINGVINKESLFYYIFYSFIFVIIAIIIQFIKLKKSEKRVSILLLIISLIALWLDDIRSLFGLMLLTYAISLSGNDKKYYLTYLILAIITIILRFTLYSHSATGLIIYLAGSTFIIIIYYHYIFPKLSKKIKNIPYDSIFYGIDKDTIDILNLSAHGYSPPEINKLLKRGVTDDRIKAIIRETRNKYGFKSQDSFIATLTKCGVITLNIDNMRFKGR